MESVLQKIFRSQKELNQSYYNQSNQNSLILKKTQYDHNVILSPIGRKHYQNKKHELQLETMKIRDNFQQNLYNKKFKEPLKNDNLKFLKKLELDMDKYKEKNQLKQTDYAFLLNDIGLVTFSIVNYQMFTKSEEFRLFVRTYTDHWETFIQMIEKLQIFCQKEKLNYVRVVARKFYELKDIKNITKEQYIDTMHNKEQIIQLYRSRFSLFDNLNKELVARKVILRYVRRFIKRKKEQRQKALFKVILIIQQFITKIILRKKAKQNRIIQIQNVEKKFKILQMNFKQNWQRIKSHERTEFHINSITFNQEDRFKTSSFDAFQNHQLTRVFKLKDKLLQMILITPFVETKDLLKQYLQNIDLNENQLILINPNREIQRLIQQMPLAYLILQSPKELKRLKSLVNANSYLVCGEIGQYDKELAVELNIPILGQQNLDKIKQREILKNSGLPVGLGTSGNNLIQQITEVFIEWPLVNQWVIKISNQTLGRGIAYLDTKLIKDLDQYRNLPKQQLLVQSNIKKIFQKNLKKILQIINLNFYQYDQYMIDANQYGFLIEAIPDQKLKNIQAFGLSFFIDPLGEVNNLGSYDKVVVKQFVTIGAMYPQKSIQNLDNEKLVQKIGLELYQNNIIGYVTIDFIAFPDPLKTEQILFLATGLQCFLNNYTCVLFFLDLISDYFQQQNQNKMVSQRIHEFKEPDQIPLNLQIKEEDQNLINQDIQIPQIFQFQRNSVQKKTQLQPQDTINELEEEDDQNIQIKKTKEAQQIFQFQKNLQQKKQFQQNQIKNEIKEENITKEKDINFKQFQINQVQKYQKQQDAIKEIDEEEEFHEQQSQRNLKKESTLQIIQQASYILEKDERDEILIQDISKIDKDIQENYLTNESYQKDLSQNNQENIQIKTHQNLNQSLSDQDNDFIQSVLITHNQSYYNQKKLRQMYYIPYIFDCGFTTIQFQYFQKEFIQRQIYYNQQKKAGVFLLTPDSMQSGLLGILIISQSQDLIQYIRQTSNILGNLIQRNKSLLSKFKRQIIILRHENFNFYDFQQIISFLDKN